MLALLKRNFKLDGLLPFWYVSFGQHIVVYTVHNLDDDLYIILEGFTFHPAIITPYMYA
jgi:hypothetical protein